MAAPYAAVAGPAPDVVVDVVVNVNDYTVPSKLTAQHHKLRTVYDSKLILGLPKASDLPTETLDALRDISIMHSTDPEAYGTLDSTTLTACERKRQKQCERTW